MPRPGWLAFVADEAELYSFVGGAWVAFRSTFTALQNLTRLGLGTSADAQNPFAAKLNKALWTALATGEGGTGDLRYTLNKQAAGNVLSLLLQTGFSGRAEIGLVGSDNLGLRVSPDGATWLPVFSVERTTGAATFDRGTLREEVAVVTATGPWTKPSWAREVTCIAIGGGGGGGSGRAGRQAACGRAGGGGRPRPRRGDVPGQRTGRDALHRDRRGRSRGSRRRGRQCQRQSRRPGRAPVASSRMASASWRPVAGSAVRVDRRGARAAVWPVPRHDGHRRFRQRSAVLRLRRNRPASRERLSGRAGGGAGGGLTSGDARLRAASADTAT